MDKTHYRLSKIDASAIYGQFVKTSTEWQIVDHLVPVLLQIPLPKSFLKIILL